MFHFLLILSQFVFAEVHDTTHILSAFTKGRVEKKIEEVKKNYGIDLQIFINEKNLVLKKEPGLKINCDSLLIGCELVGLDPQTQWSVADVSTRAFHILGLEAAVDRSVTLVVNRLGMKKAPWENISFSDLLFDKKTVLPRDNLQAGHFMTEYIANYIRELKEFPTWFYTQSGGVWFAPFHINFYLTAPHRVLGYLLAYFTSIPVTSIYKLTFLWFGIPLFLIGVYWLAFLIFKQKGWAVATTLTALFSSITMSFIHVEQFLGSIFYIPYLWIVLLKLKEKPRLVFIFVSLLGLSLTVHYPQLIIGYFLMTGLALAIFYKDFRTEILETFQSLRNYLNLKKSLLAVLCLLISLSTVFYTYFKYKDSLYSPIRGTGIFDTTTYADYETKYKGSIAGIDKRVFEIYTGVKSISEIKIEDERVVFWNVLVPVALLLLCFVKFRGRGFLLLSTILLALMTLGSQTFLPRIFFYLVPTFKIFRVWNTFVVYFNLHLLFLMMISLREFTLKFSYKRPLVLSLFGILGVLSAAGWDLDSWKRYEWVLARNNLDYYSLWDNSSFVDKVWRDENLVYKGSAEFFTPKGLDIAKVKTLASSRYLSDPIRAERGGFRFYINEKNKTDSYSILQVDDGNWEVAGPAGVFLPIVSSRDDKTIVVKIDKNVSSFLLRRKASFFPYLLFGMWIPFLLSLGYEFLKGERGVPRLYSSIGTRVTEAH